MTDTPPVKANWLMLVPVGIFAALAGALLAPGLRYADPSALPSALIGQIAPMPSALTLPGKQGFDLGDMADGEVKLVNFWASWCVPCRAEHPRLKELVETGTAVYGVNYKDDPKAALAFLEELGDPYAGISADTEGRTGIDWGLTGVPETFVVNGEGRISYRHIGPLTPENIASDLLPAIQKARTDN